MLKPEVNSKFTSDAYEVDAYTEPFDLGQYKRNSSLIVHYHSVRFQGLKPDTLYAYRVGRWIQELVRMDSIPYGEVNLLPHTICIFRRCTE